MIVYVLIGFGCFVVGMASGVFCIALANASKNYETEIERMKKMTGNKYQELAGRTINRKLDNIQMEYHALHGMVGEIGEIHSLYQKVYQGHDMDGTHLQKELGDLLWFIAEFCTANGWNMEDIMDMNIEKLKKRFPDGFSEDQSLHRKEGDI